MLHSALFVSQQPLLLFTSAPHHVVTLVANCVIRFELGLEYWQPAPDRADSPRRYSLCKNDKKHVCFVQAKAERASQDATLLINGCKFEYNVVFHGVLIIKGHLQSWLGYERIFVSALMPNTAAQPPGHSSNEGAVEQAVIRDAASW